MHFKSWTGKKRRNPFNKNALRAITQHLTGHYREVLAFVVGKLGSYFLIHFSALVF
jgi:hypothetical protein